MHHIIALLCIIILGVTLFLSHYFLDPITTYRIEINVVDISVPSFTVGVAYNLLYISGFIVKNRVYQYNCIIKVFFYLCIFLEFMLVVLAFFFIYTLAMGVGFIDFITFIFSYYNSFGLYIYPLFYFIFNKSIRTNSTCNGIHFRSIFATFIFVLNFIPFVGLLVALGVSPYTLHTASKKWGDTVNHSYGSTLSFIFVAFHVAFHFLGSVLLLYLHTRCMYHVSNEYTDGNPLLDRTRESADHGSR